jgi:hypothetical protein
MNGELKNMMAEYIHDNVNDLTYETTAELAVIYASKMDDTYRGVFFKKMRPKFLKELKYLKEETLYKILWSLIKAKELKVTEDSPEWVMVKDVLIARTKELSPKVLSDLLLLSTMEA